MITAPFRTDLTREEAIALQKELRAQVRLTPLKQPIYFIAGVDVSLNRYAQTVFAGWVVLSYPELRVVEESVIQDEVTFPYIPGLLSFREIPPLLKAWEKLQQKPDLVIVDGAGVAHPRRLGIATHLGLVLDIPTIGCAKSRLTGVYDEPSKTPFSVTDLYVNDRRDEVIGSVIRTKARANPLFISAGHRITQEEAREFVMACVRGYRLPEPTRLAHLATNQARKRFYGT